MSRWFWILVGVGLVACESSTAPTPTSAASTTTSSPAPETTAAPPLSATASASAAPSAPAPACPPGEVLVPATGPDGFVMGRASSTESRAHRVVLTKPFCMDQTEVTVQAYEACVKADACPVPRLWGVWINYPKKSDHPMNKVSWTQAKIFCEHHDKSLPTEAQWEWAVTGGDEREWPWGNDEPTCKHADFTAGHLSGPSSDDGCHGGGTSVVGTHPAGDRVWPGGRIHDLAGNVWEWVLDNHAPYPAEPQTDPLVQTHENAAHVVRGGGWNRSGRGISARFRGAASVDYKVPGLGFRCVRNLAGVE